MKLARITQILGWSLLVLAYLGLVWQQVRYGIEYDEGSNLSLINNFASGNGYASTGLSWVWYVPFDPGASTGPTVIMPSSFVWWATDGNLALSRLVPLVLFALLPISLGLLFGRIFGNWAALVAASSPLMLAVGIADISTVSLVPGRFIGEFVGTAFLASMALAFDRKKLFIAGLSGGLAISSKFNFALPVLVVLSVWLIWRWSTESRPTGRNFLSVTSGLLLPLLAFEVFKFSQLGTAGYIDSSKAYVAYLLNQGGNYPTPPLSEVVSDRLAALSQTLSPFALLLLIALVIISVLSVNRSVNLAPSLFSLGPVLLVVSGISILLWWLFSAPQNSPRLGLPTLLLILPVILVGSYSVLFSNWSVSTGRKAIVWKVLISTYSVMGLLILLAQGTIAAGNAFGERLMNDQKGASQAILNSGTPSLPYEFIWNLSQFQLLTGIPLESKPGVDAPSVLVYDSIHARVATGIDDARELLPFCDLVLYSSVNAVVCTPLPVNDVSK